MNSPHQWWRHAVVYQVYVRSFADGNGDGIGDIAGLRSRLDYLAALGVDAIWVNPWYESPLNDGGYDVTDFRTIHPLFGTLEEARLLMSEAADLGLRVIVDLVPNHTSSEHRWFKAALAAAPGSPERARYHFLDGKGSNGAAPPNNWQSVFGGPAWTRVPDGQWYLHLFDVTQPDLNWNNPEVRSEFCDVIRYWVDMGAAGFRIDVAHGKVKHPEYPDLADHQGVDLFASPADRDHPLWDRPEVHDIIREWRTVLDDYPETLIVAEAWLPDWDRLAEYLGPDQYHQAFDFLFAKSAWDATEMRKRIAEALRVSGQVGSIPTWVLSNHDVVRHTTRYGLPSGIDAQEWLLDGDRSLLDEQAGLRRARATTLLMLALPGSAYLYQGEELGLPEVHALPVAVLDDPTWKRSGHTQKGRDGCRVPIPWTREGESYGFGANGSWLPQPESWADLSVEAQDGAENSSLELYRRALRVRHEFLSPSDDVTWLTTDPELLEFTRGGRLRCLVNFGTEPVAIPHGEVLASSARIIDGSLPGESAVWVATEPIPD